jgi:hypothetical protein
MIKYWMILVIFLAGSALTIIGGLFKIQHWMGASLLLTVSLGLQVISVVLLIIKLIVQRNTNGLNK